MGTKQKTAYRCRIRLTNTAKEKMRELKLDEQTFFLLDKSYHVYIEKYPQTAVGEVSAALFLDNKVDEKLADLCNGDVVVLHCVVEKDRFIVTNVTTRPGHIPIDSNWRKSVTLTFDTNAQRGGETLSLELLNMIHHMPVAKESSQYVKKRIASWEGYLKIQERTADIPDMTSRYSSISFNNDFSRMTMKGCQLKDQEWSLLKDLSVKLKGIDQDVGKVLKANRSTASVEVELHGYMEEHARAQRLNVHPKEVTFSNFATLSQVKRLRQGFKQLENGMAANPELERLLFENKPPVKEVKKLANLQFHNRLNEFQQKAVTGAMSAEDLYVIQGPPGTGKTTVISEICLQNARAGLRTLVASQSNLAVDNALGRLLANKDIRILRVGRTESIEEEGKKFIEENVGQYWKDHTLKEVSSQFEMHKQRQMEVEAEWATNEQEHDRLQKLLERVEAEVKAKKEAEQIYSDIQSMINTYKQERQTAEQKIETVQQRVKEIEHSLHQLKDVLEKDQAFLAAMPDTDSIQQEWDATEQEIARLQKSVAFQELEEEILEQQQVMDQATLEYEKWKEISEKTEALSTRITEAKKVDTLKWIILERNLKRTLGVQQYIQKLEELREEKGQFDKLKAYYDQLNRAMSYVAQLLEKQKLDMNQIKQQMLTSKPISTNSTEIDQFLEGLRNDLKNRSSIYPDRLVAYLQGLYGRRQFVKLRAERLKPNQMYIQLAQEALHNLKQELLEQVYPLQNENRGVFQKYQKGMDEQKTKLTILQNKREEMLETTEVIPNVKELLVQHETRKHELQKKKQQYEEAKLRVEENGGKQDSEAQQLKEAEERRTVTEARLQELNVMVQQKEEELLPLQEILASEPEHEHENVLRQLASISFNRESLKQEKQKLPLFQSVQGEWLSLLKEANDHDLNEIRKLYVKHSNVIGTTCVASARKDFIENYPVFDVVIIDEVSKATPPELLLPMLKGKKIILVGDHHQLPPLLGNDTLEEALQELADENGDFEGKAELNKLLKESLFERLFKNLPASNKTMLAIQYRMHEKIMKTITPFYEQESDRLQCGLTDSDSDRDHMLESPLIQRNNHLLWLDIPNEPSFFEERMKGGKSLYNAAELERIAVLLKELDEATARAKEEGRIHPDEKKHVGVISFYGEQVKRIDRMIHQELRLPNVTIRTGTVDRFQGMEMDVILLSMVRNHENPRDDIGFARDYRRLNVALSRARELLVLIGSTKMFTERTRYNDTKQMYTHVLDEVRQQNGLRVLEEVSVLG